MVSNSRRGSPDAFMLQSIEPRVLLSADYAVVGVQDDRVTAGMSVYMETGSIDDFGAVTGGERRRDDTAGAGTAAATGFTSFAFDENKGSYSFTLRDSGWTQPRQRTSNYRAASGYSAGWYLGTGDAAKLGQFGFQVERPTQSRIEDLAGPWGFNGINIERAGDPLNSEVTGLWGIATFSGSAVSGTEFWRSSGTVQSLDFTGTVGNVASNGTVTMTGTGIANGTAYLSRDKSVLLWSDMVSGDNEVSYGIAVKRGAAFTAAQAAGTYRVALMLSDEVNDIDLGTTVVLRDLALKLNADGTYQAYDLGQYDAGGTTIVSSGAWTISGDQITIQSLVGTQSSWVLSSNGSSLLPQSFTQSGQEQGLGGLGVRVHPTGSPLEVSPQLGLGAVGLLNHPFVYERGPDDVWRKVDLSIKVAAPSVTDVQTWVDARDGQTYLAGRTNSGVILLRRAADGNWSYRHLTAETLGSRPITSELTVYTQPDGKKNIAGLDSQGHLVTYRDKGVADSFGHRQFEFIDITTQQLTPVGETMPTFTGSLVSYVTSWGGVNIAGLDQNGDIQVIWTSDELGKWAVDNLTQITGASKLNGGLTVYLTSWGGINLGGIDSSGEVNVTWWVPGFGGEWRHNNLTTQFSGPTLGGASVTSYVTQWGGLNIAGVDSNGDLQIYWWAPGLDDWQISRMTNGLDAASRPQGRIQAQLDNSGRMYVYGETAGGDLMTMTFELGPNVWTMHNLTRMSPEY